MGVVVLHQCRRRLLWEEEEEAAWEGVGQPGVVCRCRRLSLRPALPQHHGSRCGTRRCGLSPPPWTTILLSPPPVLKVGGIVLGMLPPLSIRFLRFPSRMFPEALSPYLFLRHTPLAFTALPWGHRRADGWRGHPHSRRHVTAVAVVEVAMAAK